MEKILLQKVDAFCYLYKAHQKKIGDTIYKRDEEMEASLNYMETLSIESLDIYNSNLRNMYNAQGEFEGLMSAKLIYVLSSFHMLFCAFYIHIHVKLIKFPLNLVL